MAECAGIISLSCWTVYEGLQFQMVCERPPRSLRSRLPLTRGRLSLFSPSVRGRAAEGGRGSLTHHLELGAAERESSNLDGISSPIRWLFSEDLAGQQIVQCPLQFGLIRCCQN
jgi:hypothetical protein